MLSTRHRIWAALLTGVPFAVFKIGGGLAAAEDLSPALGALLLLWGALDLLLNGLWVLAPHQAAHCLLSNLGRQLDRRLGRSGLEQVGLAVDTLAAFAIVSTMLWFGRIGELHPLMVRAWELAVIANILGVGLQRVWRSIRERRLKID